MTNEMNSISWSIGKISSRGGRGLPAVAVDPAFDAQPRRA